VAEIRPFRGVRYNQSLVKDLSAVICPPYDIITPQTRQELYHRSEYNFVRLESGRELPQDTPTDNKYARSSATLAQWLEQDILKPDETPAIYVHDQYFTDQGKEYKRRGLIARVRLAEWDEMVVRPHEGTLALPKDDRVSLLWALQANTSPILALFQDQEHRVASVLAAQEQDEPTVTLSSDNGERHNLWAITAPEVIDQICRNLARQPLYIADGHHRYESALTYQRELRSCSTSATPEDTFNFVMMTLVDFADSGLIILPPHRLLRGVPRATINGLKAALEPLFEIEELPLNTPDSWQQLDAFLNRGKNSQDRLALFGLSPNRLSMLRLHNFDAVKEMMPYFHSELYKRLAVSVVDHVILERVLGLSTQDEALLAYTYDRQDAVNRVLDQEYQMAILLSPIRAEVVKAIADAGDRMPRKSTYFYPKLPSGLVLYHLT
jgi:uncharacterized protein (DUF1015 family)